MPKFIEYYPRMLDRALLDIRAAIYEVVAPLDATAWTTPEPVPFAERRTGRKLSLKVGDRWGGLFDCAWFHFAGKTPAAAAGKHTVLLIDVRGELCVVDAKGSPQRGLTLGPSFSTDEQGQMGKRVLQVSQRARSGQRIDVWADAGCNTLFGKYAGGTLAEASIAVCNDTMRALYYDFEVLLELMKQLPEDSPRRRQIREALNEARHLLRDHTEAEAAAARRVLAPVLAKRSGDSALKVSAVGHAHIDLAWMWPERETIRKGARTFATALDLIDRYPGYVFGASQPQLFQWMKDHYPALYRRIKRAVRAGRIEVQGAMWVEADVMLSGGEALVRQVLHGKRFFRDEFGVDVRYLWLPDVFGYTAALPQILKKAGVDYFMTQKMSWNRVNKFPYHSFRWRGLDGTEVLAHMLPESTYNSQADARALKRIERSYVEADVSEHALMLYGIGDGGGGPGAEHLERIERLRDLDGVCPVAQESAADFFEKWRVCADRLPSWVGELYLEYHLGCLTTQARNKWCNRRTEQTLREWEWTSVLANGRYPAARLQAMWREALLYQFHDILPGSSIKRVYDESVAGYRAILDEANDGIRACLERIARRVDTSGMKQPVVLFNSLSWPRTEWVKTREAWQSVTVPSMGYAAVDAVEPADTPDVVAADHLLESDVLRVKFGRDGAITSIYDKVASRETLAKGERANRLAAYADFGDAWDFPPDYRKRCPRHMKLVSSEASIDGPRAVVTQTYRLGHSELVQDISLTAGRRQVDFTTRVTWLETKTMLRTSFPVAVHAEQATYDVQFGHLRRPTHTNTTWEMAKDEVAAHKWADLSQSDRGVALLNDSKYGHRIKGNVIELALLRSVPHSGEQVVFDKDVKPGGPHHHYTDQGEHIFRYALMPHDGDAVAGGVMRAGYEFNIPLRMAVVPPRRGPEPASASFIEVDSSNVVVEAVKKAEDGDDVIVRLYETDHADAHATLRVNASVQSAAEVNLMEEEPRKLRVRNGAVRLDFSPFEIKTVRLTLDR